jgi:hypothetical protein
MADAAQVIYLDQRGSGRSDHGDPRTWTWQRWAEDVAGFCRALEIRLVFRQAPAQGFRAAPRFPLKDLRDSDGSDRQCLAGKARTGQPY